MVAVFPWNRGKGSAAAAGNSAEDDTFDKGKVEDVVNGDKNAKIRVVVTVKDEAAVVEGEATTTARRKGERERWLQGKVQIATHESFHEDFDYRNCNPKHQPPTKLGSLHHDAAMWKGGMEQGAPDSLETLMGLNHIWANEHRATTDVVPRHHAGRTSQLLLLDVVLLFYSGVAASYWFLCLFFALGCCSAASPSNSDREEQRWRREEQRWIREEQRWLWEEQRWAREREALLRFLFVPRTTTTTTTTTRSGYSCNERIPSCYVQGKGGREQRVNLWFVIISEAFDDHKNKYKVEEAELQKWRSVLKEIANISGNYYPSPKYETKWPKEGLQTQGDYATLVSLVCRGI
ncbi:hypothetical protein PIB30_087000 [Stylosanthes scabra]|uniref:PH domain-containing protein n=1 Tax=Stylosanthes scabra TaxID=79078 RepID=A0ABU6VRS2_9FABA|nr:hypothetical protein [Stylosanthes scabra]